MDVDDCVLGYDCNPCWPIECVTGDSWAHGDCMDESEVAVFHAERQKYGSTFKLSLDGFGNRQNRRTAD